MQEFTLSVDFYGSKGNLRISMWVLFGSFFMFSNFYQLDLHNETRVAITNLQWNARNNRIENRPYLDVVMVIESSCLLIS